MQVDRHVERFGPFEDRPERLVVQEASTGVAIDQGALEPQLGHRPLELVCRRSSIEGGENGESREAIRVIGHGLRQHVVDVLRHLQRVGRIELLDTDRRGGEHLNVDPSSVHLRQPALSNVPELLRPHLNRGANSPEPLG
jgi:hypothetical protein